MAVEPGSQVELRDVLLLSDGGKITVGSPLVADALVIAEVMAHGKGKKVINFKFKAKTRYRRKRGHRQGYTRLTVREIRFGDVPAAAVAAAPRRRAAAAEEPAAEEPTAEAVNEPTSETTEPVAEEAAAAAPRRRRTTAAPQAETQE